MMLNHIGQNEVAEKIQNAWLKTIEEGIHTADIFVEGISKKKVGTKEFADAVITNLGQKPETLRPVSSANSQPIKMKKYQRKAPKKKQLVGVDLFVDWRGENPDELAMKLQKLESNGIKLNMITNRGIKVWPEGFSETFCTDHWRCRFKNEDNREVSKKDIIQILSKAEENQLDSIKTENLYLFDGVQSFSLGQGQ